LPSAGNGAIPGAIPAWLAASGLATGGAVATVDDIQRGTREHFAVHRGKEHVAADFAFL
jgi:hypothetical protein